MYSQRYKVMWLTEARAFRSVVVDDFGQAAILENQLQARGLWVRVIDSFDETTLDYEAIIRA